MGDEAFARRYYADRAELQGLGVPITSGRDEFTGEELYTLREEQYFLPPIDLNDQELAALLNCLGMLDGQFAYAEPLRLALQNLALGRHVSADPGSDSVRVNLLGSVYTPEIAQRLAKLELAISKQRTVRFSYRSLGRRRAPRAADQPLRPVRAEQRLVRDRRRPRGARGGAAAQDVPRVADGQRDQVRHPPRARLPDPRRLRRQRLPRPAVLAAGRRDRGRSGALDRPRQHVRRPPAVRPAQRDHRARRRLGDAGHRVHRPGAAVPAGASAPRAGAAGRAAGAGPDGREGSEADRPPAQGPAVARDTRAAAPSTRRRRAPPVPRGRSHRSGSRCSRRCSHSCSSGAATRPPPPFPRRTSAIVSGSPRTSSRSTSTCSTWSTSAAAATRSTARRTTARCMSTRSCTATPSAARRGCRRSRRRR